MKVISISILMAYIISTTYFFHDSANASFWNILYGFAAMLAIFDILNLKIRWAAAFGCVAYSILAFKISSAPITTNNVSTGTMQIGGLIAAAGYCLLLVIFTKKKYGSTEADGQNLSAK